MWLRKGNASGEGALMQTCVQPDAPMTLGSPAVAWKSLFTCTCSAAVFGQCGTAAFSSGSSSDGGFDGRGSS